jgi:uncharacterized protein YcbX
MCFRAHLDDSGRLSVQTPDGSVFTDPLDLGAHLSDTLGRPVELKQRASGAITTLEGAEEDSWDAPEGSFFDATALHLISDRTLASLRRLEPSADFDVLRFRPNFLVSIDPGDDFPEEAWIGSRLAIGPTLEILVVKACSRCVMTTHEQGGLPRDKRILRTVARQNGNRAGVRAEVVTPGPLAVGDQVRLA